MGIAKAGLGRTLEVSAELGCECVPRDAFWLG
jgi:hypothetical protein